MNCIHNSKGFCNIATGLAGSQIEITQGACETCSKETLPFNTNRVTVDIAIYGLRKKGLPHEHLLEIRKKVVPLPGTNLKDIISWFPIPNKSNCKTCRSLEAKMNKWGPSLCLGKKKEYILNKLHIAAKRRNLPYSRFLVEKLLTKACKP